VGHLVSTFVLAAIFLGIVSLLTKSCDRSASNKHIAYPQGFTKSLLDLQSASVVEKATETQMASSLGYISGFLVCAFLLAKLSRFFLLLMASISLATALAIVPWANSLPAVDAVYTVIGVAMAVLMAGGNVVCLDFWGARAGPYIMVLHFSLSLGLWAGPAIVWPLSQTTVPYLVQEQMQIALTTTTIMPPPPAPLYRVKRTAASEDEFSKIDPVLLKLFGQPPEVAAHKPKPTFTDARKLDNSRDWETVKVAKPPPEELVKANDEKKQEKSKKTQHDADSEIQEIFKLLPPQNETTTRQLAFTTTTVTLATTKSPQVLTIKNEMKLIKADMKKSQELIDLLKGNQDRPKRSPRGSRSRIPSNQRGSGFDVEPSVYGRPRIAMPPPPAQPPLSRYPSRHQQQGIDYNSWSGNDYSGADYPIGGFEDEVTPPPKKVVEAVKTIEDFWAGKDLSDDDDDEEKEEEEKQTTLKATTLETTTPTSKQSSTTLRSTTTTSTTTATTEKMMTTTTETATTVETFARRKKPTGSFDNDTATAGTKKVTILNFLNKFGVRSHQNVGFILDSVYTFLLALVLFICLCYNPREPRSASRESAKSSEESRIFKYSFSFLLFFLSFTHWSMFVSFRHVLPSIQGLLGRVGGILSSDARHIFVGIFTASRFFATFTPGCFGPAVMIILSLSITFIGSVMLVFAEQVSPAVVWAGVIMEAVGIVQIYT
jgi:hypothetical protein